MQYTSLASAFLTVHTGIDAQVIYTDSDPDIILDSDFELAGVDMDNNGTIDFAFLNVSYTSQGATWNYSLIQKIWAGAYGTSANQIAGTSSTFIIHKYYPYALDFGDSIDNELSFQNAGYQRMAYRIFITYQTWEGDTLENSAVGGHWYPEILDHYLGVHFVDEDHNYHYGWIRCDVKDEGRTLVIKDYAYESEYDIGIVAGDVGDTTTVSVEEIKSLNASIYNFNNLIFINLDVLINGAYIYIYDLSGKLIYSDEITDQFNQIKLNEPKGVYVVKLIAGENNLFKKIYIN